MRTLVVSSRIIPLRPTRHWDWSCVGNIHGQGADIIIIDSARDEDEKQFYDWIIPMLYDQNVRFIVVVSDDSSRWIKRLIGAKRVESVCIHRLLTLSIDGLQGLMIVGEFPSKAECSTCREPEVISTSHRPNGLLSLVMVCLGLGSAGYLFGCLIGVGLRFA